MPKYTIEVESLYGLAMLAPLAELLVEKDDELSLYIHDALGCLFAELSSLPLDEWAGEDEMKWKIVAGQAEQFAQRIRQHVGAAA